MKARRCAVLAVVLVLMLGPITTGHAANRDDPFNGEAPGVATSIWEATRRGAEGLWTVSTSLFAALDPFEYLPEQMPNRDRRFAAVMEAAGYRLTAIDTQEGLLGRVRYHFTQQRAPVPDDLERLRRGLSEHRAHHGGAVAVAERRVLRALLMVGTAPEFRVAAVNIDVLPWPKVSFHLMRRETVTQTVQ